MASFCVARMDNLKLIAPFARAQRSDGPTVLAGQHDIPLDCAGVPRCHEALPGWVHDCAINLGDSTWKLQSKRLRGSAKLAIAGRDAIELAWLWLRHQPGSTLSEWFHRRVAEGTSPRLWYDAIRRGGRAA